MDNMGRIKIQLINVYGSLDQPDFAFATLAHEKNEIKTKITSGLESAGWCWVDQTDLNNDVALFLEITRGKEELVLALSYAVPLAIFLTNSGKCVEFPPVDLCKIINDLGYTLTNTSQMKETTKFAGENRTLYSLVFSDTDFIPTN